MRFSDLKNPVVTAHRGISSIYPENTMPAFEAAIDLGCQMLELDVSLTSDDEFVVIHDETIDRTTNGKGLIADIPYRDICSFDAGLKLSKGKISTKIPLLKDVLKLVKNKAILNIEVKSEVYKSGRDEISHEAALIKLISQEEMIDQIIFSSFNHKILKRLRRLSKDVKLGILTKKSTFPPITLTNKLDAFSWHPGHFHLTKKKIKLFKKYTGKKIIPYTINSRKKAFKLLRNGVDGFFTDYPQKFI